MSDQLARRNLLEALVSLAGNVEGTIDCLRTVAPTESSVLLDRANIRLAVEAFLKGELSADHLEQWAEAVHGADDVILDPSDRDLLADALFELSTPELFGTMEEIVDRIREWVGGLSDI